MAFETGHKKVGGRKKGTPNKRSKYLYDHLDELKFKPVDRLVEILPSLPPDKQASILLNLLSFLYPKRKSSENGDETSEEMTLVFDCDDKFL